MPDYAWLTIAVLCTAAAVVIGCTAYLERALRDLLGPPPDYSEPTPIRAQAHAVDELERERARNRELMERGDRIIRGAAYLIEDVRAREAAGRHDGTAPVLTGPWHRIEDEGSEDA